MQADLRAHIIGYPAVSALIADRAYWGVRPEGSAVPAIRMGLVSSLPGYTMQGPDCLTESRVQIDMYAPTYAAVLAVKTALVPAISGFRGTAGGTDFRGIFIDATRDGTETGHAEILHRMSIDIIIFHQETEA